ncbi:DUF3352 domain-containing protein [Thermosynechococcaceae cyanobacterium BACA0444]|uniref:DUF3352 domain-containing protein n=1 Tax=Pseudocalidococcus azoricus BACA0444 TaxID=2918990 RepID=A0AAE4JYN7_9CYAN|nr:DUF3352 domain-containing protein [Pseudocalidococcus azoricus]MDS3859917.1 DUF3352 domain-containing protein [Pseudocalidococcus azoricus BACA0444]
MPRQAAWMVTLTQPLNKVSPQMRPVLSEFFESQWDDLGLGRAGGGLLAWDAGLTLVNMSPISAKNPQPLWIIPIKDAASTEKALSKFWEKLEITPVAKTFQGIPILTPGPAVSTPSVALGIVGNDYLVVSQSVQALEESLVAAQSVNNILGANFYREANLNLTGDTWGLSYLNLGTWSQDYQNGDVISPDRLFLQWENLQKPVSGLGIGTTLISSKLAREASDSTATKLNLDISKRFPSHPAAVGLGHDLPDIFNRLDKLLTGYGAGQPFLAQTRQALNRYLGINLETDLWPWLIGDFGLAIFPPTSDSHSQAPWYWQLTTPTNPTVTAGLETLEASLQNQGWLTTPREFEGITAQAWSSTPAAPPTFVQAQDQTFTTLATEMTELHPSGAATQTPAWQPLLTLDSPDMLLHLDWATHQQAWQTTFPLLKVLEVSAPSLFAHLNGITWLGLGQQGKVYRGEVILAWEK